jgi:hypothetical protein
VTALGVKERGFIERLEMKGASSANSSVVTRNTNPADHPYHAAAPLTPLRATPPSWQIQRLAQAKPALPAKPITIFVEALGRREVVSESCDFQRNQRPAQGEAAIQVWLTLKNKVASLFCEAILSSERGRCSAVKLASTVHL